MNSESRQKLYWQNEHQLNNPDIPSMASDKPSLVVQRFINFLREKNTPLSGSCVDIGSGKGRNAIYLAKQGLKVTCLDFIDEALKEIERKAKAENLINQIETRNSYISSPWEYPDNYFDFAIDCYASIDIEAKEGRATCISEMYRCLKPGGYACLAVVAADDEHESEVGNVNYTEEPNAVIWTNNNKFQKNYTLEELEKTYNKFIIFEISKIRKEVTKMGEQRESKDYFVFMQKPK
ncbi:MAG: class I SAM-dependent methyltransferase [Proteobacteria bacterium]|nr:class I SAM-dependent methyltransferase [Pseudomonadota bacterium]